MVERRADMTLRLFGVFGWRCGNGRWQTSSGALDAELLYLLAVNGDALTGEQLAESLWPGMGEHWTAGRLNDVRARLRRRCGRILQATPAGWQLDRERVSCDLWEARSWLQRARAADGEVRRELLAELLERYPHVTCAVIAAPRLQTPALLAAHQRAQADLDALYADVFSLLSAV